MHPQLQAILTAIEIHGGLIDDHSRTPGIGFKNGIVACISRPHSDLEEFPSGVQTRVVLFLVNEPYHSVNEVTIGADGVGHLTRTSVTTVHNRDLNHVVDVQAFCARNLMDYEFHGACAFGASIPVVTPSPTPHLPIGQRAAISVKGIFDAVGRI